MNAKIIIELKDGQTIENVPPPLGRDGDEVLDI